MNEELAISRACGMTVFLHGATPLWPWKAANDHVRSSTVGSWKSFGELRTARHVSSVMTVSEEPSEYWTRIAAVSPAGPPVFVASIAKRFEAGSRAV